MSNLFRMDLYQLRKSKLFKYSLLGLSLFSLLYAFFFVICLDEELNAWFLDHGFLFSMNFKEAISMTMLGFYQKFLSMGIFIGVMLIVYGSLLHTEFENGFIKNIGIAYVDKKGYIIAKLGKAAVMSALYILCSFAMFFFVGLLFPKLYNMNPIIDILTFLFVIWLLTTGLCSFVLLLIVALRNKTIVIIYAVLLATAILPVAINYVLSMIHLEKLMEFELYYRLLICPIELPMETLLPYIGVSVVDLVICSVVSYIAITKKDIA